MPIILAAMITLIALPLFAQPRVEYGKPRELWSVEKVYVWTFGDDKLRGEVLRQLQERLPMLQVMENEGDADFTVTVGRAELPPADGEEGGKFATSLRAARVVGKTIRLYLDVSAADAEMEAAVRTVLSSLEHLLQGANAGRFGVPDADGRAQLRGKKAMIHTTAGLHPGLTKKEVRTALGRPTKIDGGHAYTSTWVYETSDGPMRLVFAGDRLVTVAGPK